MDRLDLAIVVAGGGAEAVHPADLAVGPDDPIFLGDRAFGKAVVAVEDQEVAVLGMDALIAGVGKEVSSRPTISRARSEYQETPVRGL